MFHVHGFFGDVAAICCANHENHALKCASSWYVFANVHSYLVADGINAQRGHVLRLDSGIAKHIEGARPPNSVLVEVHPEHDSD